MNMTRGKMGPAICMTAALLVVNAVQAQSRPVATTPAKAPATAPPADGTDTLFAQWDTNHDKVLSPAEFKAGWQQLQATMALRRLHEQFAALDTDKSGSLDAVEYAHLELIKHAGASAPPMSAFDTDKNQHLDFKEYVNAVNYMLQHEHK
jgi:hypothetical protein